MRNDGPVRAAVLLVSAAAHVAVLAALAASRGAAPEPMAPPPVMQVDLVPAYVLPARPRPRPEMAKRPQASPRAPSPRLARRPAEEAPIAPLVLPQAPSARPPGPGALDTGVREALRGGALGCANPDALGLDARARARCLERLGAGARETPFIPAPLSRDKQAEFDKAAARKAADRKYREAPIPPGLSTSDAPGGITGLGETGHGAVPFP